MCTLISRTLSAVREVNNLLEELLRATERGTESVHFQFNDFRQAVLSARPHALGYSIYIYIQGGAKNFGTLGKSAWQRQIAIYSFELFRDSKGVNFQWNC